MRKIRNWLVLCCFTLSAVVVTAQDAPDDGKEVIDLLVETPSVLAGEQGPEVGALAAGPIFDSIGKKIDRLSEGLEARDANILDGLSAMEESNRGILARLQEAAKERRELQEGRQGLLARFSSFGDELRQARADRKEIRTEMGRWTPLQNIVERINGLIMRMMFTMCLIAGGIVLFITIVGWLLNRSIKKITKTVPQTE